MKTAILTIALALASSLSALAQTVMRENSTVYFQTNVYLHDDPTNALHTRISVEGQEPLWVAASNEVVYYQGGEFTNGNFHASNAVIENLSITGDAVVGTRTRGYAASTNLGDYGFAAGAETSAGNYGFAAGDSTSAGNYGFAAGAETSAGTSGFAAGWYTSAGVCGFAAGTETSAGDYGFAAGAGTSAGDYGFAAGVAAIGADGSFVFADYSASGTPFNRTNRPNEFSARAAGGVYFDTPMMAVTGTVSAGNFAFGDGTVPDSTSWLQSDGTNLFFVSTVPPGFTNALTTNAP